MMAQAKIYGIHHLAYIKQEQPNPPTMKDNAAPSIILRPGNMTTAQL